MADTGLTFEIKGTNQVDTLHPEQDTEAENTFEGIYDLFAIRIIDSDPEKEKQECWQVYPS